MSKRNGLIIAATSVVVIIIAICIIVFVSGGRSDKEENQPTKESTAASSASGEQLTEIPFEENSTESVEEPEEPKGEFHYCYFEEANQTSDNLFFQGYMNVSDVPEEHKELLGDLAKLEKVACYIDVSEVRNVIGIPTVYCTGDNPFKLSLMVAGKVDLCAFDIVIRYNTDLVTFVQTVDEDEDLLVNVDAMNGLIYMNFLRIKNLDKATALCELEFLPVIATNDVGDFSITMKEAVTIDASEEARKCDASVVDGHVILAPAEDGANE